MSSTGLGLGAVGGAWLAMFGTGAWLMRNQPTANTSGAHESDSGINEPSPAIIMKNYSGNNIGNNNRAQNSHRLMANDGYVRDMQWARRQLDGQMIGRSGVQK